MDQEIFTDDVEVSLFHNVNLSHVSFFSISADEEIQKLPQVSTAKKLSVRRSNEGKHRYEEGEDFIPLLTDRYLSYPAKEQGHTQPYINNLPTCAQLSLPDSSTVFERLFEQRGKVLQQLASFARDEMNHIQLSRTHMISIDESQRAPLRPPLSQTFAPVLRWTLLSMFPLIDSVSRIDPGLKRKTLRIFVNILQNSPPLSLRGEPEDALDEMVALFQSTTWEDPRPLPSGWESRTHQGRVYYLNHTTRQTSWDDPRPPIGLHTLPPPNPFVTTPPNLGCFLSSNAPVAANLFLEDPEVASALLGVALHRGTLRHILAALLPLFPRAVSFGPTSGTTSDIHTSAWPSQQEPRLDVEPYTTNLHQSQVTPLAFLREDMFRASWHHHPLPSRPVTSALPGYCAITCSENFLFIHTDRGLAKLSTFCVRKSTRRRWLTKVTWYFPPLASTPNAALWPRGARRISPAMASSSTSCER